MPDSTRLLELALKGLEAERAKIDDEIAQITSQLNPRPATAQTATAGSSTPLKKRRMSAAARKKISEAMKRRYAELNSGKRQSAGSRLTEAGRKRLSDLMKKRWAEKRRGKSR
ncbi:MAG: hypothetical protein DMG17_27105 [Acidobacteria bacterium]|nr:MAG: hypothetical protein DMG17_27105 [Acidobacteriota bacterium]